MAVILSISNRKVLNSHVKFTNEFEILMSDGAVGHAASPQGETISIYEDRKISVDPQMIIQSIQDDGLLGEEIDQAGFDGYLQKKIGLFGRNNVFGLSEAFFNATCKTCCAADLFGYNKATAATSRLCLNILNGGWHAYTNPVMSDFSEFLLAAKSADILEVIGEHNEIQRVVRERQARLEKSTVAGNPVHCFKTRDNREVVDFLLKVVEDLGLSDRYDLMIDASAGDLWNGEGYHLGITDGQVRSGDAFFAYWMDWINQYPLRFLEDPFAEKDFGRWQDLTANRQECHVIGDNLYSSDENRIREGIEKKYTTGVVIKPNQAGTITAVSGALEATLNSGQVAITSHRSISTESTFLSLLTWVYGAPYIKIGPLATDYSSVLRLNEIIRLTEGNDAG